MRVGGAACTQPYAASLLNISAMSYGALSGNAVEALNNGARLAVRRTYSHARTHPGSLAATAPRLPGCHRTLAR